LWAYYYRKAHPDATIVLTETDPQRRELLRNGRYHLNIATSTGRKVVEVDGIEVHDPEDPDERDDLLREINCADDLVTAVPNTGLYSHPNVGGLIAEGLKKRYRAKGLITFYASENEIGAAKKLKEEISAKWENEGGLSIDDCCVFVDTTIGRMGGPQDDPGLIEELGLKKLIYRAPEAFLIEEFDRIIIERIEFGERFYEQGFPTFEQVDDIGPYEDVKLLGHNAVHFLLATIGFLKDYRFMSDYVSSYGVAKDPDLWDLGRAALVEESGEMLMRKFADSKEPIFVRGNFIDYAGNLMWRIANPHLMDLVKRVGADPERKEGLNDRVYLTMRQSLDQQVVPKRYAIAGAAGLMVYQPGSKDMTLQPDMAVDKVEPRLNAIWKNADFEHKGTIVEMVKGAFRLLKEWYPHRKEVSLNDHLTAQGYFD